MASKGGAASTSQSRSSPHCCSHCRCFRESATVVQRRLGPLLPAEEGINGRPRRQPNGASASAMDRSEAGVQQRQCLPLLQKSNACCHGSRSSSRSNSIRKPCCQGRRCRRVGSPAARSRATDQWCCGSARALLRKLETEQWQAGAGSPGWGRPERCRRAETQLPFPDPPNHGGDRSAHGHQIKGHGIDREIAARKVSLKGSGFTTGFCAGGVVLLPRRRQIKGIPSAETPPCRRPHAPEHR